MTVTQCYTVCLLEKEGKKTEKRRALASARLNLSVAGGALHLSLWAHSFESEGTRFTCQVSRG